MTCWWGRVLRLTSVSQSVFVGAELAGGYDGMYISQLMYGLFIDLLH